MFAEKYGSKLVDWGIDTKDFKFLKMEEVYNAFGKTHRINGMYITDGKFGKQAVLILAERKVLMNIPSRMVETVNEIMHDKEAIEAIKNGLAGVEIYSYTPKNYPGKICYSVNFIDMPNDGLPF